VSRSASAIDESRRVIEITFVNQLNTQRDAANFAGDFDITFVNQLIA